MRSRLFMQKNRSISIVSVFILLSVGCKPLPVTKDESVVGGNEKYEAVSYYTFDSMNADDVSGYECHGYPVGEVKYTDDTPSGSGKALFLNGMLKQYVSIPHNVFAGNLSYSISFWIKDFTRGSIIAAVSSELPRCDFPRLWAGESAFTFYTRYDNYDSTESFVFKITPILSPDWHHVVITCENNGAILGNNALRCLYVDGKLVDKNQDYSQAYVSMHGWEEDIITSVHIGGDRNGYYSIAPSMKIDNIRFYLSAIPSYLVKELYESRK